MFFNKNEHQPIVTVDVSEVMSSMPSLVFMVAKANNPFFPWFASMLILFVVDFCFTFSFGTYALFKSGCIRVLLKLYHQYRVGYYMFCALIVGVGIVLAILFWEYAFPFICVQLNSL
jgi:hypothetical protein